MGNNEGKGKQDKSIEKWITLDEKEKKEVITYSNKFVKEDKTIDIDKFSIETFAILAKEVKENVKQFLNSYYEAKGFKKRIDSSLDIIDIISLANILLKVNSDYDELIYNKTNTFLIIYDIIKGKAKSHSEISSFDLNDLLKIFNFAIFIYFNKYAQRSQKFKLDTNEAFNENFNKELRVYLKENIITNSTDDNNNQQITLVLLEEFIERKLYALDGFLKNYFRTSLLNKTNDEYYANLTSFPLFNDPPSIIPIYQFFFFCLSNTNISSKPYAFKLYDCKIQGYNLSNLIYSFIGFTGPISIMVQHYDEKKDKIIILGMYINSNFKECYEKFCGDDLSYIFVLEPKMTLYKCVGDTEKICYISSKNQKFSKTRPGIGMGNRKGQYRFWLDSNELFSKSFFNKYDNVFEEGSPFEDVGQNLNIGNIEVFGFGDEDALEDLMKKQQRDKMFCDKMKKVDKSAFVDNEFDKEMFFSKGFAYRNSVDERAFEENEKQKGNK